MAKSNIFSGQRANCLDSKCATRGFTLIEVLIALLVLAIGLVGIASLHLSAMRAAHSSYYTSIASSIALDFEERLWLAMADVAMELAEGNRTDRCLIATEVSGIIADLKTDWEANGPGKVTIPDLTVNTASPVVIEDQSADGPYWAEIRINLEWDDDRFGGGEVFPYTARVVCAPQPEPAGNGSNGNSNG